MTQNANKTVDELEPFYEKNTVPTNNAPISPTHTHAVLKENTNFKNSSPTLFSSEEIFSDLPSYFKESHDYLLEIFTKIGDGKISANLSYEERDEQLKLLEDYKDNMIDAVQKATVSLSEDISKIKRMKVKSNVDTSNLKKLVFGASEINDSSFGNDNNLFVDPDTN